MSWRKTMFIQLDFMVETVTGRRRVQELINTNMVEQIILNDRKFLILFGGGDEGNVISFDITAENKEFFTNIYDKIVACLIWKQENSNVIQMS